MIHVCFGLSDKDGRYSKFTGTAMLSMFENTHEEVTVHILHDNTLSNDNRDKLSYIAGRYHQHIEFHNVEEVCKDEIERINQLFEAERSRETFSMGKFYRLMTPYLLSEEVNKIIYLDSDIIVHLDIAELWKYSLGDKPLAAISEIELKTTDFERFVFVNNNVINKEDYFNSGVMLISLKNIREKEIKNLWSAIEFRASNQKCYFYDQDCLNLAFSKNYLKLPNKFNNHPSVARITENIINQYIYHYAWNSLHLNFLDKFNELWFSYFEKTPWFNKDIIGHLSESFRQILNQREAYLKNMATQSTVLMSGKTRAFFTTEPNIEFVQKVFNVREDEEIIPFVGQESLNALAKSMFESRGKKVYFMLLGQYYQLRPQLINSGFVEGRDFVNAAVFLSNANGVISENELHQLIRNM